MNPREAGSICIASTATINRFSSSYNTRSRWCRGGHIVTANNNMSCDYLYDDRATFTFWASKNNMTRSHQKTNPSSGDINIIRYWCVCVCEDQGIVRSGNTILVFQLWLLLPRGTHFDTLPPIGIHCLAGRQRNIVFERKIWYSIYIVRTLRNRCDITALQNNNKKLIKDVRYSSAKYL